MGRYRKRKRSSKASETPGLAPVLATSGASDIPALELASSQDQIVDGAALERNKVADVNQELLSGQKWSTVPHRPAAKKRKIPRRDSSNYPSITLLSNSRHRSPIKISDLQDLVLYILGDGVSPQWICVRHYTAIRRVIVLMVPGLERNMFEEVTTPEAGVSSLPMEASAHAATENVEIDERNPLNGKSRNESTSVLKDLPVRLSTDQLQEPLWPLAAIFHQVWPVLSPGDDKYNRMHSPILAMLISPLPKMQGKKTAEGRAPREAENWEDEPVSVMQLLATQEQLHENDFPVHFELLKTDEERASEACRRERLTEANSPEWIESRVGTIEEEPPDDESQPREPTRGREVLAMDCEMCKTSDGQLSLARISIIRWDGSIVMDELVKPEKPIVDYLTP